MCVNCYLDFGTPKIDNPTVRFVAKLILYQYDAFGEDQVLGGNLHVQLDDWNIEGNFFKLSPAERLKMNPTEILISKLMGSMSELERASALAIANSYWRPDDFIYDCCKEGFPCA